MDVGFGVADFGLGCDADALGFAVGPALGAELGLGASWLEVALGLTMGAGLAVLLGCAVLAPVAPVGAVGTGLGRGG